MIQTQPATETAILSGTWKMLPKLEWLPPGSKAWLPLEAVNIGIAADRTQQTRWTLSAKLTGVDSGPFGIHPYGCLVRAFIGVQPLRSNVEYLAYGKYVITSVTNDRESVTIQGVSQEIDVQGAQFPKPRNLPDRGTYTYRQQAQILLSEAIPTASFSWDPSLVFADNVMPSVTVDRDRWGTLYGKKGSASIANALGADLYCDRNGVFTFAPVPTLSDADPVATLAWDTYEVTRQNTFDRQGVFNLVVVTGQTTGVGSASVGPAFAWDRNPASLTYAGPNPIKFPAQAGAYGVKTYFYNSALVTNNAVAATTANAMLANMTGYNNYLTLTTAFDPRIEVGDVIWVDVEDGRSVLSIVDKIGWQLDTGAITLTTRTLNDMTAGLALQ